MPSQQMLVGLGKSGPPAGTDIATVHGVSSTAQTNVVIKLDLYMACTSAEPAGWGEFRHTSNPGIFISGFWATPTDHRGIWKSSASGDYAKPTNITIPGAVSASNMYMPSSYAISHSIGSQALISSTGGYSYSTVIQDYATITYTFYGGLGSAKGFVIQGYGTYAAGQASYHTTPLIKVTIGSVTRVYAAKGDIAVNSTSTAGTGYGGFVVYPTVLANWGNFNWSLISGTQLPNSYFA